MTDIQHPFFFGTMSCGSISRKRHIVAQEQSCVKALCQVFCFLFLLVTVSELCLTVCVHINVTNQFSRSISFSNHGRTVPHLALWHRFRRLEAFEKAVSIANSHNATRIEQEDDDTIFDV